MLSCTECDRVFHSHAAHNQHFLVKHPLFCWVCGPDRQFTSRDSLYAHQQAKEHGYGDDCNTIFLTRQAWNDHTRPVRACQVSEFHCFDCDRAFGSARALEQHMDSPVHKPISDIVCPAAPACYRRFTTPSALVKHLESGTCVSGLNRQKVNALVTAHDSSRLISAGPFVKAHVGLIKAVYSDSEDSDPEFDEDDSDDEYSYSAVPSRQLTPYSAYSSVENHFHHLTISSSTDSMGCPLCDRTFINIHSLQQHMLSVAHAPKIFHCPTKLLAQIARAKGIKFDPTKHTQRQFSTVSGMIQHLESGACQGGREMLGHVARFMEGRMAELGYKGLKLVN